MKHTLLTTSLVWLIPFSLNAEIELSNSQLAGSAAVLVQGIEDGNTTEVVADEVDNWVACSRCNEWRIVPSGQFLTFQERDVKFHCSLVGASCQLVKKRHRG